MTTKRKQQKLNDGEKATLLEFIHKHGRPEWSDSKQSQHKALALLCGWEEKRAKSAYDLAYRQGYLEKP